MGQARLLRISLAGNAVFSAISGAVMLFAPDAVSETLGWTGPDLWPLIGAGLWIFAADLLWQARRSRPVVWRAFVTILGDGCWVLATIALAFAFPSLMNATGWGLAIAVAVVVALFGLLQLGGLDRLQRADAVV